MRVSSNPLHNSHYNPKSLLGIIAILLALWPLLCITLFIIYTQSSMVGILLFFVVIIAIIVERILTVKEMENER
jgi:hypothetical protein